jgi:predicted phosphodiesterase
MKNIKKIKHVGLMLAIIMLLVNCKKDEPSNPTVEKKVWKFAVVGDTHVTTNSDTIKEMIPYFLQDSIELILICGDIVEGGKMTTSAELETELKMWQTIFQPLYDKGIGVYPIRGNHEDDATDDITVWNKIFTGTKALPQNGPSGEINLTYSFNYKNAMFVGLDNYVNIHKVNQSWLNEQLASNKQPHVFVFGHEAAFKVFHADCLDDFPTERNTFWKSLTDAGVKSYFCGHDHFFDATQIDDGDGNKDNDIYQCLVGGGGGWLMSKYNYNGVNTPYKTNAIYHKMEHGYLLVEISGETSTDVDVTIAWKERSIVGTTVKYTSTDKIIKYKIAQKLK